MNLSKQARILICGLMLIFTSLSANAEVVVIVSEQSPISKLTNVQLADIFLGKLNQLPDGKRVIPIDQAEGSPARNEFYSNYLALSAAQIKAHWSRLIFTGRGRPPKSLENDAAMAEFVADNPDAIGYLDSDLVNNHLKIVEIE